MDKKEFVKLYVNADEETRKAIERILEEAPPPFVPLD